MKKTIATETAAGFKEIHKHQAVIVLTDVPGKSWKGVILSPSPKLSLVRYNEAGTLRERRVSNLLLVPAHAKPKEKPEAANDGAGGSPDLSNRRG